MEKFKKIVDETFKASKDFGLDTVSELAAMTIIYDNLGDLLNEIYGEMSEADRERLHFIIRELTDSGIADNEKHVYH